MINADNFYPGGKLKMDLLNTEKCLTYNQLLSENFKFCLQFHCMLASDIFFLFQIIPRRIYKSWRVKTRTSEYRQIVMPFTGKSLSEALIFASTNPQYDSRLSIELQVQCMKIPSSEHGEKCCVQKLFLTFRTISVQNMFSHCSAKILASDKDLAVYLLNKN